MIRQLFLFCIQIKHHKANAFEQLKYFFRWRRTMEEGASSVRDEQPWVTFQTIDYLKTYLNKQSNVFEYGGGGSTLFFIKHSKHVVTVEHNKEWFGILSDMMSKKKYTNWTGNFMEAQVGDYVPNPDMANPDHYSSEDFNSKGHHYHQYATAIDKYDNGYFDVILIDGRSRPSCMKHSIPKLKQGGLLILDNSDRTYYLDFFHKTLSSDFITLFDKMGACPYSKDFTKTSVWIKK